MVSPGITKGVSASGARGLGGLFKFGFRAVIAWISIIFIIFWLIGTVPKVIQEEGVANKINAVVFEILAPIAFADNSLYLVIEKAHTTGIHKFEKKGKVWCGLWFCSEWLGYNKETLDFIGSIFWRVWFIFSIIYLLYRLYLPKNTSEVYKAVIKAITLYLVLLALASPIMWYEDHAGEPIPQFKDNWGMHIPGKGVASLFAYFMKVDSFFYDISKARVYEKIGWNQTDNSTSMG